MENKTARLLFLLRLAANNVLFMSCLVGRSDFVFVCLVAECLFFCWCYTQSDA